MKLKNLLQIFIIVLLSCSLYQATAGTLIGKNPERSSRISSQADIRLHLTIDSLYELLQLKSVGLNEEVFYKAYKGYLVLKHRGTLRKGNILTICDYSQSIASKRLYVIDLKSNRLLFNTFVAHGEKSGGEFANTFSNAVNSNKSCLGFLLTADTYNGSAGYSMRFKGLEKGINDRVQSRSIVLHGSLLTSSRKDPGHEVLQKSLGCPAVPYGLHTSIINTIKGGSCFFIHHPDEQYASTSRIVNASLDVASL